jgi:AAHS family 3-hydroxyphenylpropionic acid transporter
LLLNWLPTLLVTDGLTRLQAAAAQIGFNIGGGLAAILIGYLLVGRLRNAGIIVTFVALPILVVILAKAPAEIGIVSLTVFFLGCAVIAAQAFLYAMAPVRCGRRRRGRAHRIHSRTQVGRAIEIRGPWPIAIVARSPARCDSGQHLRLVVGVEYAATIGNLKASHGQSYARTSCIMR